MALAGLLAANVGCQDADGQVHAGVAVAQGGGRDHGAGLLTFPPAGGGGGAAGALGHVFVDLQVFVVVAVAETLDRSQDHLGVEFLNAFPGKAHTVQCAGAEVLDQHVAFFNQLFQNSLAFRFFGVQRQRTLVAVEHGEVQGIDVGNVTQLAARHVAGTGALDLDDVGAKPCQQLGAGRAGLHVREVDDFDAVEGFVAHGFFSLRVARVTSFSQRSADSDW